MDPLLEDLVDELDRFEHDVQVLRDRIGRFIDDARQVAGDDTDVSGEQDDPAKR